MLNLPKPDLNLSAKFRSRERERE
eukprot:SAG31_NODE_12489_length_937_cov_22.682578_1_plen_23_part_10